MKTSTSRLALAASSASASRTFAGLLAWVIAHLMNSEIISEEQTHIDVIRSTITELGGTPNGYCNYSFPNVTCVSGFRRCAIG